MICDLIIVLHALLYVDLINIFINEYDIFPCSMLPLPVKFAAKLAVMIL